MREAAGTLRHEFIGLYGMVERNWYLIKRYAWWEVAFFFWTAANTLTIVFIAKGVVAEGGTVDIDRLTTILLIGAVMWSYLGIVFELLIETVAWERWEGTIEYTFMAPLTRATHLLGTGIFAIGYGIVRASIVFAAIAAFFGLHMPNANFVTAVVLIAVASISFVGIGMMTAVLPLISPEKGTQFGYVAQGLMLVVSGVYYPVSVLPQFMQWLATISPATYALRGERSAILDGTSVSGVWGDIWPMLIIGIISVPLGIWVFRRGELHAKKHGKLKRSG
jgi:ABC-2 type transport system permease protein